MTRSHIPQPPSGPPPTPNAISRAVSLFVIATALCLLAAIAWPILGRFQIVPRGGMYRLVSPTFILFPIFVLLPFWHWRVRKLRSALFASRFRLCTNCAYDLSTHAPTGVCPECGCPFNAATDVEIWAAQGAPYTEPRPPGFTPWSAE